ncbi:MAG: low specificity L-threonine aldolase [Bacteroidales bacterium]|jgi:threonine aldolase
MKKDEVRRGFASDNNSGVHPEIMKELSLINTGHELGYGADRYTRKAEEIFKQQFGDDTDVYFVFTGTAANVLGINNVTRSWNSIITANSAHLQTDECGAPEKFTGCKVISVDTPDGKITPQMVEKHVTGFGFEHHAQPKIISITQSTEMGTVYSCEEIKAIADFAHSHGLLLHMDGARLANASVFLDLPFREITTSSGVDILSFGGTKNGMMGGEAICYLKPGLASDFKYVRKQGMQLASKMRYISAQYIAYFRNDLWRKSASHSNSMAAMLAERLKGLQGIRITQKVQSNGVFVVIPDAVAEKVCQEYFFYPWDEKKSEYRLMTSWDTTEEDIDNFIRLLKKELESVS